VELRRPVKIFSDGTQEYWENGERHRPYELGPARIEPDGTQEYWEKGELHRPHQLGPALIMSYGSQCYYEHGKLHHPHELGPVIIGPNGTQEYYEHRNLFEKVLGLPANHYSVLGKMYPKGGDLYKEKYKDLQNLLESF
jgi:hypothetical protein